MILSILYRLGLKCVQQLMDVKVEIVFDGNKADGQFQKRDETRLQISSN